VKAICTIRPEPNYRRDAFEAGLQRVGYTLDRTATPAGPEDLLILWNRKPNDEPAAQAWEARGGSVLVCENGYIGKDAEGRQRYAISVHGHNGSGWFPEGTEDRFAALGIELAPWRTDGQHLLICAQRGIGSRKMASPPSWEYDATRRIGKATKRVTRVRAHPGNKAAAIPLENDLADAWACVIWSSSAGVKALTLGVPVLYDAPHWICERAARPLVYAENPLRSDVPRLEALRHMAHGQWSVAEIESGEPFARILANIKAATWPK
jgi:hypothetical protein